MYPALSAVRAEALVEQHPGGGKATYHVTAADGTCSRLPEEPQSVAFVGLDRSRRAAAYRSIRRGTAIEDRSSSHRRVDQTATSVAACGR